MNDILFGNNNKTVTKKITKKELASDRKRNFFIIMSIFLTSFMLTSVFSIGISYYKSIAMSKKRMQGSVSHMAFAQPTEKQLSGIYALEYVEDVGIGASVAETDCISGFHNLPISYVDEIQWKKMFSPAFTNIVGHYPKRENEIMLSRYILDALEIKEPEIGMTISLSFVIDGEKFSKDFKLSCIYTEYAHYPPNNVVEIYCSRQFAEKYHALETENLTVNVIFSNSNILDNIEKLKSDLSFYKNQPYTQSPVISNNRDKGMTYIILGLLVIFMMFAGYLLIYNVMYISVSRSVRFMGMLKTLGTTPKQIQHIVMGQVLRLCLIGLPLGCISAAVTSMLIIPSVISNSGIETGAVVSFSPFIYIGAIVFSLLTAWLGAITPARKAAAISPIEALHYTDEYSGKMQVHHLIKGKPLRMAYRNLFRDRKRFVIVILSLFLSITVFTGIISIINSIDIDNYVNSEYDYDFFFTADATKSYYIEEPFIEQVTTESGIENTAITKIGSVELLYTDELSKYASIEAGKMGMDTIIEDGTFLNTHTIKGIDTLEFNAINQTLGYSIDKERFERGETAIINTTSSDLIECFRDVPLLNIRNEASESWMQLDIGGIIYREALQSEVSFGYSDMEILVSNSCLESYVAENSIVSFGMDVKDEFEEQIYNNLKDICSSNDVLMVSRYEGRESMRDTKTIMLVLGGGISLILGFIGIFNFVNVMSVGVVSRRRELATLESIGMSKKQLRAVLRYEGIGYALITLLLSATVGSILGYGAFKMFKNLIDYAVFHYPVLPVGAVYLIILFICWITPELAFRGISKDSLVERLRQN